MKQIEEIITPFYEKQVTYDYGCVMLHFTFWDLPVIQSQITNQHIYTINNNKRFGLETKPHVTLLYGLHPKITETDVAEVLSKFNYSECVVDNVSMFQRKYDVLKFDVSGSGIVDGNASLRKLKHTIDFPKYEPHLTVAYLKPGHGERYIKKLSRKKYKLNPTHLEFTRPNGKRYKIHI